MNINGRRVQRFRAHIDPMILPRPMNSIDCVTENCEAELTPAGVYVKVHKRQNWPEQEHIVPYSNVQSIKLLPEDQEEKEVKKKAA